MSGVTYHVSHVTCHLSPKPTATATDLSNCYQGSGGLAPWGAEYTTHKSQVHVFKTVTQEVNIKQVV